MRIRLFLFAGLGVASGLMLLITRWLYSYITRSVATPAMQFELSDVPVRLFETGPSIFLQFGQFFSDVRFNTLIAVSLLLILILTSLLIIQIYRNRKLTETPETRSRWIYIYLASLWFLIFGPLPYILLDYDPGARVYSSAVYGVFPLILMLYETARKQYQRIVAIALLILFGISGLVRVVEESIFFNQREAPINFFYRSLKDAVPHVRPHTAFVIINWKTGHLDCGPSLEMLYNQDDLECLAVYSNWAESYIRRPKEFEIAGKPLADRNLILIAVINNTPVVVDELKPGDFDLLIKWESTEPLRTNSSRILTKEIPLPSPFYRHLLERAKVLFPPGEQK